MWCIKQHKPGGRGAPDLQELWEEGGVAIKGLTLLMKGSPSHGCGRALISAPAFCRMAVTKEVTSKGLEKRFWRDASLTGSTWPPEGHPVMQQLRSNCIILLYTSVGLSGDANNSLSLWQKNKNNLTP